MPFQVFVVPVSGPFGPRFAWIQTCWLVFLRMLFLRYLVTGTPPSPPVANWWGET